ncbi:hypothetical protein [Bradyrhizobium sp. S69]|uniref:hypothetical protein n=1 Tax=Bradyrhizobium sp. S69 TaxID=1641856 RepID=UPI00131DBD03|nr:hypothetical protein [Bradyrhizobium sp. S69]
MTIGAMDSAVILRCAHLRASKDGREHAAEHHPSRLAEDGEHLRMTALIVSRPLRMTSEIPLL